MTTYNEITSGGSISTGVANQSIIARPRLVAQKHTITFEVDLNPSMNEVFGPITNQKNVAVYNVRTVPHEVVLTEQRQYNRSMWIPGLSSVHGRNLKHGERVAVQGSQAQYALKMFTTANGPPVSGMELLKVVDEETVVPRGFYPPVTHPNTP